MLKRFTLLALLAGALLARAGDAPAPALAPAPTPASAEQILKAVKDCPSRLVVVNIWATWCVPCRKEFPHFVDLRRQYHDKGVEVIFVSADFEDSLDDARKFLTRQGVTWTNYLKTDKDEAFIAAFDSDWSGSLPATIVYLDGKRVDFWEKPVDYPELETHITKYLK